MDDVAGAGERREVTRLRIRGEGSFSPLSSPHRITFGERLTAAKAIRAARAMREELARISIDIRSGIHFGEVQESEHDLLGVAVHIAARVMSQAEPGEIPTDVEHMPERRPHRPKYGSHSECRS